MTRLVSYVDRRYRMLRANNVGSAIVTPPATDGQYYGNAYYGLAYYDADFYR